MVQEAIPVNAPLSDDPVVLQRLLREQQRLIQELLSTVHDRDRELAAAHHRLEQLLRRMYGPRSERVNAEQPGLFDDSPPPPEPPPPAAPSEPEPPTPGQQKKKGHGRRKLPKHLKRIVKRHELPEAEKLCPCCQKPRVQLSEEISEQLDYEPASLYVIVHIRPKFACLECLKKAERGPVEAVAANAAADAGPESAATTTAAEASVAAPPTEPPLTAGLPEPKATVSFDGIIGNTPIILALPTNSAGELDLASIAKIPGVLIITAPMPKQPIPKGLPAPGLLAHIITSKFADHLPLYRQEKILGRQGGEVSRKTMGDWLAASAELFTPLYELMKQRVLQSRVTHNDDTPVPVLAPKTGKTKTGRLWVSVGDTAFPYNIFNYTEDRSRDGPLDFFKGYKGFLQVDAYSGYERLFGGGDIWEAACWAHVRRYFFEAKTTDAGRSHEMLAMIRGLYDVEVEVAKLADEAAVVDYRGQHCAANADQNPQVAKGSEKASVAQEPDGRSNRLRAEQLEGDDALHPLRFFGHRQQRGGACVAPGRPRAQKLVICRERCGRPDCGGAVFPDQHLRTPWHRTVGLPARRANAAAGTTDRSSRRTVAGRLGQDATPTK